MDIPVLEIMAIIAALVLVGGVIHAMISPARDDTKPDDEDTEPDK